MTTDPPTNALDVVAAVRAAPIPSIGTLLVAVSGGPDSVALLRALHQVAVEPGRCWELHIVHIDHGLRGENSRTDARFVEQLAGQLKLPHTTVSVDTRAHAAQHRQSVETAAREVRWAALRQVQEETGASLIATGHTVDDQAETVVMRLLRGAGGGGLRGMSTLDVDVVRPLLGVTHEAILAFLQTVGQGYRLDESNRDPAFFRNRVRGTVMPALESAKPGAARSIARTASLLAAEEDLLQRSLDAVLPGLEVRVGEGDVSCSAPLLAALHPALRGAAARHLFSVLVGDLRDLEAADCDRMLTPVLDVAFTGRCDVARGVYAARDGDRLLLSTTRTTSTPTFAATTLPVPGSVTVGSIRLDAQRLEIPDRATLDRLMTVCDRSHCLCDAAALDDRLTVRPRRAGDRLRPLGAPGSRSVQDVLVDAHLPRVYRDQVPVVVTGDRIVWLAGIRSAHEFRVTERTEQVILLTCRPEAEEQRGTIPG